MNRLNTDQVVALAPDASALKSGRELSNERKWLSFACNERVVWGEVQGSGKDPYRTQADLDQLAFKCSCPSRKFPCKHGLGLLFLFAQKGESFPKSASEPAWVSEWMDKRQERAVAKEVPETAASEAANTAKRAKDKEKRDTKRQDAVEAGAAELELWLRDLLRAGLLTLPEKGASFFDKTAARMVDAKATGLANWVTGFNQLPFFNHQQWQGHALGHAARLYLLLQGLKNIEAQSPAVQEDIRALVGWNLKKEEVLQSSAADLQEDQWMVLSKIVTQEPNDITVYKFWLFGEKSRRFALLIDFAYKNMPVQTLLVPGTYLKATLVYYPSNFPLRALIKEQADSKTSLPKVQPDCNTWAEAQTEFAQALAQNPWTTEIPLLLGPLHLAPHQERWFLLDAEGAAMEIAGSEETYLWEILAQTGGQPAHYFVLRTENTVKPILWQTL